MRPTPAGKMPAALSFVNRKSLVIFMFPKQTTSFDPDACAALALAAQTAYSKASEAEIICAHNGAQDFYWIEDVATDTQCFVAISKPKVVVAFRGTTSVR